MRLGLFTADDHGKLLQLKKERLAKIYNAFGLFSHNWSKNLHTYIWILGPFCQRTRAYCSYVSSPYIAKVLCHCQRCCEFTKDKKTSQREQPYKQNLQERRMHKELKMKEELAEWVLWEFRWDWWQTVQFQQEHLVTVDHWEDGDNRGDHTYKHRGCYLSTPSTWQLLTWSTLWVLWASPDEWQ